MIQQLVKKVVESLGLSIRIEETIDDGLKVIKSDSPRLLILDINLPGGKTGVDYLDEYHDKVGGVPVLVLTTSINDKIKQKCQDAGIEGYVEKPLNPKNFAGKIKSILDKN